MELIQIVPRLGPMDGVGDYATHLGQALQDRHGISSRYVEGAGAGGRQAVQAALERLDRPAMLLHYVGYGYARRGAPLWLLRAIERHRGARRLGVVFHELYATGWPWQSSFWLSGVQQHIAKQLACTCDFALLTRQANRDWLDTSGALAGKLVGVLPIPSGVGEPVVVPALHERPATLVIWGSTQVRQVLYGHRWKAIAAACQGLGITAIVDIGPPATLPRDSRFGFVAKGRLPEAELSDALRAARFGLLAYPASFLGKSSVLAAFAAHGVLPIVLDDDLTDPMDGLVAGRHFLRMSRACLEAGEPHEQVARNAREWYVGHAAAAHADVVKRFLAAGTS